MGPLALQCSPEAVTVSVELSQLHRGEMLQRYVVYNRLHWKTTRTRDGIKPVTAGLLLLRIAAFTTAAEDPPAYQRQ